MSDDLHRLFASIEPPDPRAPRSVGWARAAFAALEPPPDGIELEDRPACSGARARGPATDPATDRAVTPPAVAWARAAAALVTAARVAAPDQPPGSAVRWSAAALAGAPAPNASPRWSAARVPESSTPSSAQGAPVASNRSSVASAAGAPIPSGAAVRPRASTSVGRLGGGGRAALLGSALGAGLAAAAALLLLLRVPGGPGADAAGERLADGGRLADGERWARVDAPSVPAPTPAPADRRAEGDAVGRPEPARSSAPPAGADVRPVPPPDAAGSPTVRPRTDGVELDVGRVRLVILDAPDASEPSTRR